MSLNNLLNDTLQSFFYVLLLFSSVTWKLSKISQNREKVTSYVVERYKEMWYGTQQFVAKTLRKVRKEGENMYNKIRKITQRHHKRLI